MGVERSGRKGAELRLESTQHQAPDSLGHPSSLAGLMAVGFSLDRSGSWSVEWPRTCPLVKTEHDGGDPGTGEGPNSAREKRRGQKQSRGSARGPGAVRGEQRVGREEGRRGGAAAGNSSRRSSANRNWKEQQPRKKPPGTKAPRGPAPLSHGAPRRGPVPQPPQAITPPGA